VEPAAAASDEALRLLLCYHGRLAWEAGLIAGRCGNLSARLHRRDALYITPRGFNKARLSAYDIQLVHLHSAAKRGYEEVSVEFPMHRACYLADPDVGAVIHTHAPALTALSIRNLDFEEMLPEATASVGPIVTIPYLPSGSWELADAVGNAVMRGARLLILEQHGVVAVGSTLAESYDRMELGELTAKTALMADAGVS